MSLTADIKVYIKMIVYGEWKYGEWNCDEWLNYSANDIKNVIVRLRDEAREFEDIDAIMESREALSTNHFDDSLTEEQLKYHFKYQPDINADIIFEREL